MVDKSRSVRDERGKVLDSTMKMIEKQYGKGAIMRLSDGVHDSSVPVIPTGSVTLDIAPVNDAPAAQPVDDINLVEDFAGDTLVDLYPVFEDADGEDADEALVYSVAGNTNAALFATLEIAGDPPRNLSFSLAPDANGTAILTLRATDTGGLYGETTVTVNVTPDQDAPTANDDDATTDEDTPVILDPLANDLDVDGDEISFSAVGRRGAHRRRQSGVRL